MPLGRTARHHRRPPPGCRVLDRDLQQRMAHPTPRPQDPTRSIHLNPRRGGSMKQTRTLSNEPGAVHENLRGVFEELGFEDVRTVISSGNVLFRSSSTDIPGMEATIEAAWPEKLGF